MNKIGKILDLLTKRKEIGIHAKVLRESILNIDSNTTFLSQVILASFVDGLSRETIGDIENAKNNTQIESYIRHSYALNIELNQYMDPDFTFKALYIDNSIKVLSTSIHRNKKGEEVYDKYLKEILQYQKDQENIK